MRRKKTIYRDIDYLEEKDQPNEKVKSLKTRTSIRFT